MELLYPLVFHMSKLTDSVDSDILYMSLLGILSFPRKRESYMQYFVYILASKKGGVLYIGVTSNLAKRIYEHKDGIVEGFTKKYFTHRLVYYEVFDEVVEAIKREKQLKKWNRSWKIELIEKKNKEWEDLYKNIIN